MVQDQECWDVVAIDAGTRLSVPRHRCGRCHQKDGAAVSLVGTLTFVAWTIPNGLAHRSRTLLNQWRINVYLVLNGRSSLLSSPEVEEQTPETVAM